MKKSYSKPQLEVVVIKLQHICNISGNQVTLDNSDSNSVGAGSSLSRESNSLWDDEE